MVRFMRKRVACLFAVAMFTILVQVAGATAMSITVAAREEATRTLNLVVEDRVLIGFTVVGGQSGNTLEFQMACPNGTVIDFGTVGDMNYRFTSSDEGAYVLRFSNAGSSEDKLVSLNYEVQHYVFGMPQMLFMTLVIMVVCVAGVAVFILMSKRH